MSDDELDDHERELYRTFASAIGPRRDLWPGTAARIARERRRRPLRRIAVAAAIAAVLAIAAPLAVRRSQPVVPSPLPPIANDGVRRAEQQYGAAIALLRREQRSANVTLDVQTIADLDAQIAAARAAVVASPDDARAVARWRAACDRKVDALRAAVEARL